VRGTTPMCTGGADGNGKELVARAINQISPVKPHSWAVCPIVGDGDRCWKQLFGQMRGCYGAPGHAAGVC